MRRIIRGYNSLRKYHGLETISSINIALTNTKIPMTYPGLSPFLSGSAIADVELALRQYLLIRFAGIELNRALLQSKGHPKGRVSHALPPKWRTIISDHGFAVANITSGFKWQLSILSHFAKGVASILATFVNSIRYNQNQPRSPYVYFDSLGNGNLPQSRNSTENHDIITWYAQWPNRVSGLVTYCHSVRNASHAFPENMPLKFITNPCPLLKGSKTYLKFIFWSFAACLRCSYELVRGNWIHPLLLREYAFLAQVRFSAQGLLASEYLFHNSNWIYRPLWTYGAESRGARITFYFYSTNCEDFKRQDKYPPIGYGWQAMTWPQYLVWDDYQADFVYRAAGSAVSVRTVGPIPFHSGSAQIPEDLTGVLAIFDIQPVRDAYYKSLGIPFEYYTPGIANQFLTDICALTEEYGIETVLKRKRIIGKLAHPKYRVLIRNLEAKSYFRTVDPNLSPQKLIEKSKAVISVPFTSAAIIAKQMGKLSAYYDPTGIIQTDDRAAHGITVISGRFELEKWLIANIIRNSGNS